MLEQYYLRPKTLDRIRGSWVGPAVEQYVTWLSKHQYAARNVFRRVPILVRFGEFAARRGAKRWEELPSHVDAFVADWVQQRTTDRHTEMAQLKVARDARNPVEQMLTLILPGFTGQGRKRPTLPFAARLPTFFGYLEAERGLRPETLRHYEHHLRAFEAYLDRIALAELSDLSPPVLSAFVVERRAQGLARTSVRDTCGVLRVFIRYLHREGILPSDLSATIEWPQAYRLSTLPRAISWGDVKKVLAAVDRRSAWGKRDYSILLLLVTYGLRAREVAALTLDDIDWKRERLHVPERKAGHSTAFPLSSSVGEALVDYLRNGRPQTASRRVFLRAVAPFEPLTHAAVSSCAARHLRQAGVDVPRPGSHTLRHTCVQRLVDAGCSFKAIGDYVGHRSPASTGIYAKVAVDALRQVALGDGEDIL